MTCVNGAKECDGCMICQDKPILKSDEGEWIYEGETYYDINGMIITPDDLYKYRKIAGE